MTTVAIVPRMSTQMIIEFIKELVMQEVLKNEAGATNSYRIGFRQGVVEAIHIAFGIDRNSRWRTVVQQIILENLKDIETFVGSNQLSPKDYLKVQTRVHAAVKKYALENPSLVMNCFKD